VQRLEIDAVHLLILVKAGEHDRLGAGLGIALQLQALGAALLHHALHRRVDRGGRPVTRPEIMLQARPARLGDGVHHAIRADRDDPVDRVQRNLDRPERSRTTRRDRFDDAADKGVILPPAWGEALLWAVARSPHRRWIADLASLRITDTGRTGGRLGFRDVGADDYHGMA
jgi:hypothetical protein